MYTHSTYTVYIWHSCFDLYPSQVIQLSYRKHCSANIKIILYQVVNKGDLFSCGPCRSRWPTYLWRSPRSPKNASYLEKTPTNHQRTYNKSSTAQAQIIQPEVKSRFIFLSKTERHLFYHHHHPYLIIPMFLFFFWPFVDKKDKINKIFVRYIFLNENIVNYIYLYHNY